MYRRTEGEPVFRQVRAPTRDEVQGMLDGSIERRLERLTQLGYLVEEKGMSYLADIDPDNPLTPCKRPRAIITSRWDRAPDRKC